MAGEAPALAAHPALEVGDQRDRFRLPDGETVTGFGAVDGALEIEDGVDAPHRLQRDRRDRGCVLAATGVRGDVGELEELAAGMRPAQRLGDRRGPAVGRIELPEAAIGVGLENAVPARQVRLRMLAPPVAGEAEQRGGRRAAGEGSVVADIDPEPGRRGFPARQQRHDGVVAVQPTRRP